MMWLENGKVMVKFTTRDLRFWTMPNKDYLNYQIPKRTCISLSQEKPEGNELIYQG